MTRSMLLLIAATAVATTHAVITPQCAEETRALQNDTFLDLVQNDLYHQYQQDYDSVCDFTGLSTPDCGLKFDGNNRTYVAACEDKGGQILKRELKLRCGYSAATFDFDLGFAPVCVGGSCNISAFGPEDLKDPRLDALLGNFSFTGCNAVSSGATSTMTTRCGAVSHDHNLLSVWRKLTESVGTMMSVCGRSEYMCLVWNELI